MSHRNRRKFTVLSCTCIIGLICGVELSLEPPPVRKRRQDGQPPRERFRRFRLSRWIGRCRRRRQILRRCGWEKLPVRRRTGGHLREISRCGKPVVGPIPGMPSGTETQNWAKEKFKKIGVPIETVTIPDPQDLPKSWEVSVTANGKTMKLESSHPIIDFARFMPSATG